jgi:hypothetical protein
LGAAERGIYGSVHVVKQIVNGLASVIAWGGVTLQTGPEEAETLDVDLVRIARDLLIDGSSEADVKSATQSVRVTFQLSDPFGGADRSAVATVASIAGHLATIIKARTPLPADYVASVVSRIEMSLGLPLSMLDSKRAATMSAATIESQLVTVRARSDDIYRQLIAYEIREAFGRGFVVWREPLALFPEDGAVASLIEDAPMYRAFCECLGVDLSPLREAVLRRTDVALRLQTISSRDAERVRTAFAPCSTIAAKVGRVRSN